MTTQPRVAITAPYPEGAIMELASRWHADGHLATLVRPSRASNRAAGKLVRRVSADLGARVAKQSEHRPWIQETAPEVELVRLSSKMVPVPGVFVHGLTLGKRLFDRSVVAQGSLDGAQILIGMAEASLRSFAYFEQLHRILHQVDAHPRYHNQILADVYGARRARHEMYSKARLEWMEAELELADRVLVPSRGVRGQMGDYGVPERKILTVPYGVSFETFGPRPEKGTGGHRSRRPRGVYVGQISLRKGLPFLIEAASRTGVALDLVGPLVPGMPLPSLPDNVRYLGTMPHEQLVSLLNSADAFVFPSLEDSFAFTPVEAAASGLPIAMTRGVGAGELFTEDSVRWIKEADVDDIAAYLREIRPLSVDERMARAEDMRSGALCRVTSWADYASTVYTCLQEASEHDT